MRALQASGYEQLEYGVSQVGRWGGEGECQRFKQQLKESNQRIN